MGHSTKMLLVIAVVLVLLCSGIAYGGVVSKDLLGGLGDFEFSAETKWVAGYLKWSAGGKLSAPDDSVAVGWERETGPTLNPDVNIIYRIAQDAGVNGSNCQYFAVKDIHGDATAARLRISFRTGDLAHDLRVGDEIRFAVNYLRMADYADLPSGSVVTYRLSLRYEKSDGSASWSYKTLNPSTNAFSSEVVGTIPAKTISVMANVCLETNGDMGNAQPGVYVDGAHLYVKRAGESNYDTEVVPVERKRGIKTIRCLYDSDVDDVYAVAKNHDYVVVRESRDYPVIMRLKYYNPSIKVYMRNPAGNISDCRETKDRDSWSSDSPIGLKYILDNHPEWLYPDPAYPYAVDPRNPSGDSDYSWRCIPYLYTEGNSYYVHMDNSDYQAIWAKNSIDKALRYKYDGIFVDTASAVSQIKRTPREPQQFFHAVCQLVRKARLDLLVNACGLNLDVYPGQVYFDPWWKPTDQYSVSSGYSINTSSNAPDGFYNESAFFKHGPVNGVNTNIYDSAYWLDCIEDMDIVARWNTATGDKYIKPEEKKWVHYRIPGVDGPAEGIDGWVHFGLCSYLLAQNEWTTVGGTKADNLHAEITVKLGVFAGSHNLIGSDKYLRSRSYYGNDDNKGAAGGIVVVNGYTDVLKTFYAEFDYLDENGQFVPYQTPVILKPHTGRVFYNQSGYKYISIITEPRDKEIIKKDYTIQGIIKQNRAEVSLPRIIQVRIDNGEWANCPLDNKGNWSYKISGISSGEHMIYSRAYVNDTDFEPGKMGRRVVVK